MRGFGAGGRFKRVDSGGGSRCKGELQLGYFDALVHESGDLGPSPADRPTLARPVIRIKGWPISAFRTFQLHDHPLDLHPPSIHSYASRRLSLEPHLRRSLCPSIHASFLDSVTLKATRNTTKSTHLENHVTYLRNLRHAARITAACRHRLLASFGTCTQRRARSEGSTLSCQTRSRVRTLLGR